jgi:hypothetical protein
MYNKWTTDLGVSIKALSRVKPIIESLLSGKIHNIESSNDEILILLDSKSGIDYIIEDNVGLKGISARVQFEKVYNTFTIRYKRESNTKTEYQKRVDQISDGYFFPAITMQAYFDNRHDLNIQTMAFCMTRDLYNFLEYNSDKVITKKSDNLFKVVSWYAFSREFPLKLYVANSLNTWDADQILKYKYQYPHLVSCPMTDGEPYSFVYSENCQMCKVINCNNRTN